MTKTESTSRKPRRMAREPQDAVKAPAVDDAAADNASGQFVAPPTAPTPPAEPKRQSKQDLVIELLRRKDGALLTDLVDATGWLPHTARAALTGLKKKGHKIVAEKVNKVTRYTIAGE
jgi:Protein of unknown function (DUF3489)